METKLLTGTRNQKVVIERHDTEWWVLHHSGQIEVLDTASAALKTVRKAAGRGNKTVTLTTIEWRGVPEGWKPPSA